jgi:hypothetical protein
LITHAKFDLRQFFNWFQLFFNFTIKVLMKDLCVVGEQFICSCRLDFVGCGTTILKISAQINCSLTLTYKLYNLVSLLPKSLFKNLSIYIAG